jgi:hypothetical protein
MEMMDEPCRADQVPPAHPVSAPAGSQRLREDLPVLLGQLVLIGLGVVVIIESSSLGLWTTLGPGPGLLPLLLGAALVGLTAIWVAQGVLSSRAASGSAADHGPESAAATAPDGDDDSARPLDRAYIAVVVVSLVVLACVIDLLGFQISMALFLLLHLRWVGRCGWLLSVALSLAGSIGVFVLFDRVLNVPLPLSSLPVLSGWGL